MTNQRIATCSQDPRISYQEAYALMREEVGKTLSTSPFLIRDYMKHLALSTGKHIRAASVLACALDREDLIHRDAVRLAIAIELIHLATLVHDDVIDDADLRRGELSLQKKYGKRTAVICGDYLLCLALKTVAPTARREEYLELSIPDYIGRVCLGELNQHIHNGNFDLTPYQYLKIIAGKTAALFEAAFHGGAVLGRQEERAVRRYARLGRYIGMIFQLTDDCMDFEATEQVAKKPVRADYAQDVITLPLIHTFQEMADFKGRAKAGQVSQEEINTAVKKTGGLGYTRLVAKGYRKKALHIIDQLELTPLKREKLLALLEKSYRTF